ncbi:hypothetical protein PFISCL1PPCAC_8797 [Pristionchus fissidentatus]|uniref:Uncharacterized protein n=1 Tax=Pristionchus fissidentatus TaxID=1538716 RepID=A0AAV5VFY4_9BILA|nr:hypothetical protein PFISCL1PPCAC_8797 [Pristionchus fissidentatus]
MIYSLAAFLGLVVQLSEANTWITGDNATVKGCKTTCSPIDYDCWQHTADYIDEALISQLRHYTTAQVALDQWYYRHVNWNGMNKTEIAKEVNDGLEAGLVDGDVLTVKSVRRVAAVIGKQIEEYSDHVLGWPPMYACPLPCGYKNTMYIYLFSISACVNLAAILFFLPQVIRVRKMSKETSRSLKGDSDKSAQDTRRA